jgi:hypothetical protein
MIPLIAYRNLEGSSGIGQQTPAARVQIGSPFRGPKSATFPETDINGAASTRDRYSNWQLCGCTQ